MNSRLATTLATWFGSGLSPFAPGTAGTAAAIPFYLLLALLPLPGYVAVTVVFIVLSCGVAARAQIIYAQLDPGKIVIDEVAGYLVTMTAVPCTWQSVLAGFFLFRVFDVLKPFPCRTIDRRMKTGTGVVLDDVAAGVYACICLHLLRGYL